MRCGLFASSTSEPTLRANEGEVWLACEPGAGYACAAVTPRQKTLTVRAADKPGLLDLREIWRYRDFLGFQARQQFVTRYKQTVLGIAWALIRPIVTTLVFTLLLGQMAGVSSEGVPYAIYAFVGIAAWQLFSTGLSRACGSIRAGAYLCSQVYFPRAILPLSTLLVGLVDYLIAWLPLLVLMAVLGFAPATTTLLVIPLALATGFIAGGIGMGLGALDVFRRDIGFLVPYVLQVGMFATPALYPADAVPESWRLVYGLNPASGLVQAHRALVLGTPVDARLLGLSLVSGTVLAFLGVWVFARLQRRFVDHA